MQTDLISKTILDIMKWKPEINWHFESQLFFNFGTEMVHYTEKDILRFLFGISLLVIFLKMQVAFYG